MWPVRTLLKLKSRRPGDAPESIPITVIRGGAKQDVELPIEDYPILLPMPIFDPPAFLSGGQQYTSGINLVGVDWLNFGTTPEDAARHLGAEELVYSPRDRPVEFARMIGKIGYSHAVSELGLGGVEDLGIVRSILGETNDIGCWAGTLRRAEPPVSNLLHRLKLLELEQNILVCEVQLFANSPSPTYVAVVGRSRE